MKSYGETPWWCQLLWPWSGPPWYAEIEDPDAWLPSIMRQFARRVDELADDLAGDDPPGEEYLAKAGRLTAARRQAEEIIRQESGPVTSDGKDDGDEEDKPARPGNGRLSSTATIRRAWSRPGAAPRRSWTVPPRRVPHRALILGACPLCCQPVTLDRLAAALTPT